MDLETPFGYHVTKPERPEKNAPKRHGLFRRNMHLIILFYDPTDANENDVALREHGEKCDAVLRFFQQSTDCQVHLVNIPQDGDSDHVTNYMASELAGKGVGDLFMIYHHGKAGHNGEDYTWQSPRDPPTQVNAYRLVEQIHKARVDCVILLDCFLPTRFQAKWQTDDTNIEFVARGQRLQDANEEIIRDARDFTYSMIFRMEGLLRNVRSGKYKGDAPRSIPEVMAKDQQLDSHPLTFKPKKPKPGRGNTTIKRIKMYPPEMRITKKIEFVAMQIQPLEDETTSEQSPLERYSGYGPREHGGVGSKEHGRERSEVGEDEGIVRDWLFVTE